ncbi:MAG: 50S ribosomal protein L24 [Calditrichaeota bacterium]|nr:50S ribosomal protein L24 [Calditrichota bacterium]
MHIKKDDMVKVISGDDKDRQGRVLKVFPDTNRIIVEGVNFIKKHTRPNQKLPQGGIVEKEAAIHASNAMVICPKCGKLTKTGMKEVKDETTNKVSRIRYCKKCGEMIVSRTA